MSGTIERQMQGSGEPKRRSGCAYQAGLPVSTEAPVPRSTRLGPFQIHETAGFHSSHFTKHEMPWLTVGSDRQPIDTGQEGEQNPSDDDLDPEGIHADTEDFSRLGK